MTKTEFNEIKRRVTLCGPDPSSGDPPIVIICVNDKNEPIHPDDLGPEVAARFKKRCEAFSQASLDRTELVRWIEDDFDVSWE